MNFYPAILTESLTTFKEQLDLMRVHPQLSVVHVDVVDGYYADNLTVTPLDLLDVNFDGLEIVFHLMVNEPLDFVYEAISIKERLPISGIISQLEHMSYQRDYLQEVKRQGWKVGLSLDLNTPLEAIEEASWDRLDILQLMSIEAGFQGTPFSEHIFPKIAEAKQYLHSIDHSLELLIDGGIKLEMAASLLDKGADGAVVGSGIWETPDPSQTMNGFLEQFQLK
jgi:ribulose-phosphate 3-epimerase